MRVLMLWGIRRRFQRLSPCCGQVAHVLRTLPPVAAIVLLQRAAPRLACVKPAASVHPEPGSNSSLYILYFSKLAPDNSLLFTYKKGIDALDLSSSVLASCTFLTVFSMISHNKSRLSQAGVQRYTLFSFLQTFYGFFSYSHRPEIRLKT